MAKATQKIEYYCAKCGLTLDEESCRAEGLPYCIFCEQASFEELERTNGTHLALYLNCSRYDVPLHPLLVDKNEEFDNAEQKWIAYIDLLADNDKLYIEDRLATFNDGETMLLRIFGSEFTQKDFGRFVLAEMNRLSKLAGTQKQRGFWGTRQLWENLPMTTEIYDELDKSYEGRVSRYKGITLDDATIETLKKITRWSLAQEYMQERGDITTVKALQDVIDKSMASEQLRRKDEKPVEELRMDSLVLALEKAGLVQSGKILPCDKLQEALVKRFVKNKKYKYSLDVADQIQENFTNNTRQNMDLPILQELPDSMRLIDEHGEFESKETEQEIENRRFAGLVKVQYEKPTKTKEDKPTPKKSTKKAGKE